MAAPGSYSVITPITTLIAEIAGKGYSTAAAEQIVTNTFQLSSSIDYSTFDPFGNSSVPQSAIAEDYQVLAMKVANILMASDGNFQSNSVAAYTESIGRFADLLIAKDNLSKQSLRCYTAASILLMRITLSHKSLSDKRHYNICRSLG